MSVWDKRSLTIPAGTPLIYVAGSPNNAAGIYRIEGLDGYVVIFEGDGLTNTNHSGLYSSYSGSGSSGCYGAGTNWLNFRTLGDWRPNSYFPSSAGPNTKPVRVPYSFTLPSHHPTYIKLQQQQRVDSAWSSISSLSVPDVNSTTKSAAQSTYDSAQSYYNVATNAGSSFTNYDNIVSKYNSIKSAYDSIVARDARLTKKADKTELNTANTNARVNYTTTHIKGTEDYTALKATLAAANKRMKL